MLRAVHKNKVPFKYVLTDIWFASAENMRFVKLDLQKDFIMALKSNRNVALSADDKSKGKYQRIDQLEIPEGTIQTVYLEGVAFPLHLMRQVFTNKDGSTGVRYLVTSDLTWMRTGSSRSTKNGGKSKSIIARLSRMPHWRNHQLVQKQPKPIISWLRYGHLSKLNC
jgi:hypothetical protein